MSIDLSKLTPAPWRFTTGEPINSCGTNGIRVYGPGSSEWVADCGIDDDRVNHAAFIALARNAFDVLDRRHVVVLNAVAFMLGGVLKTHEQRREFSHWLLAQNFTDIFTALVEADRWISDKEKA